MRILLATGLYPPEEGGPATYSKMLSDELPKKGIEVVVIPFSLVRKYPVGIRHFLYLIHLIRKAKGVSIIYAQDTASVGFPAYIANVFLRKKLIVRIPGDHVWEQGMLRFHFSGPPHQQPVWSWKWHPYVMILRRAQLSVVRSADALVVPGNYLKKVVMQWGVEKERIHVIQNAAPDVSPVNNNSLLRGLIQFDEELIVTIGRLVPWKGIPTLVSAFSEVKKQFPKSKLLIIGGGPQEKEIEKQIKKFSLEDEVRMTGRLTHDVTLRYLETSDVFVLNTLYEGLSHLILEAMKVGTPVITTKEGGNPEVITNEKNGLLVQYDNQKEIVKAIVRVLSDKTLSRALSSEAMRNVEEYSREVCVSKVAKVFKRIA